jgi:hypothetical protein
MKKMKDYTASSATRRQWPRCTPDKLPSLKGIVLNQGNQARVVDISRGGALIETDVRLHPNMKIVFKMVTTQGVLRVAGSVLRSFIKSLGKTPIYQSAIVFDSPLTLIEELDIAETKTEEAGTPMVTESENDPVMKIAVEVKTNTLEESRTNTATENKNDPVTKAAVVVNADTAEESGTNTAMEVTQDSLADIAAYFENQNAFELNDANNNIFRESPDGQTAENKPASNDDWEGFMTNPISSDGSDGMNNW